MLRFVFQIYTGCYDGSLQAVKMNLLQNYRCWVRRGREGGWSVCTAGSSSLTLCSLQLAEDIKKLLLKMDQKNILTTDNSGFSDTRLCDHFSSCQRPC